MNNELENSINYITKKTSGKTGFSIPENYLNGIEDDFLMNLKEEQLPKELKFDIPEQYFDNLEDKILAKATSSKPKNTKVINLKSSIFKLIPTAVAASLLLFLGLQFFNKTDDGNALITFEDISYAEVETWFNETTSYTDNTELAFTYEDNTDENELASLNNDVIEDYLNTIDHDDLLNEIH